MKRKFVSVVVCLAFLALLAIPAALTAIPGAAAGAPPDWYGDHWTYGVSYNSGPPPPDGNPVLQNHTMSTADWKPIDTNYREHEDYVPDADRNTLIPGTGYSPVTVESADVYVNKDNMQVQREYAQILVGTIADNITVDYAYDSQPVWPPEVGATWDFTKRTWDDLGMVDYTVDRRGEVLEKVDVTVPAGTFNCWHIVEYDPADPGTITYEHWFNEEEVGSDVKMVDRDTYQGEETRELTSTYLYPTGDYIYPNVLGNGKGNKKTMLFIERRTGTEFKANAKVLLRMAGQKDIKATRVRVAVAPEVPEVQYISCYLNLIKAVPGNWDVVVVNTDTTTWTLAGGLKVKAHPVITSIATDPTPVHLGNPDVHLTISGSDFVSGATVELTQGRHVIKAPSYTLTSGTITCHFNMSAWNAHLGAWKILVTNPDGGIHWAPAFKVVVKP